MRLHEPYTDLKLALAGKGKTYKDVSEVIGVNVGTVSQKINGFSDFTISEFQAMAKAFDLSLDIFLP